MAKPTNITGWAHVGYIMVQPLAIYTAIPLLNSTCGKVGIALKEVQQLIRLQSEMLINISHWL